MDYFIINFKKNGSDNCTSWGKFCDYLLVNADFMINRVEKKNKLHYVGSKKKGIFDLPLFPDCSLSELDIEHEVLRGFENEKNK